MRNEFDGNRHPGELEEDQSASITPDSLADSGISGELDPEQEVVNQLQRVVVELKNNFGVDDLSTAEVLDLRRITLKVTALEEKTDRYRRKVYAEGDAVSRFSNSDIVNKTMEIIVRWLDESYGINLESVPTLFMADRLCQHTLVDKTTGEKIVVRRTDFPPGVDGTNKFSIAIADLDAKLVALNNIDHETEYTKKNDDRIIELIKNARKSAGSS